MANYYATARTNYFEVEDEAKFIEWTNLLSDCEVIDQVMDGKKLFGIMANGGDQAGWPSTRGRYPNEIKPEEEQEEYYDEDSIDIDFVTELSGHLKDVEGNVAILMEAGAEKFRYVIGVAIAVNANNDIIQISLDDIYQRAADEWKIDREKITSATY